jgi:hypothetical protein
VTERPAPPASAALPLTFAGIGVVGLAGFVTFASLGKSEQRELEATCAPDCVRGDVDAVRTKYLVADVSLGVAVVSLGVAGYLWLTAQGRAERAPSQAWSVGVVPGRRGGALSVERSFE